MTRKDYEALAAAIRAARAEIEEKEMGSGLVTSVADLLDGTAYAAEFIADALARDNPRFNRERFLSACGVANG